MRPLDRRRAPLLPRRRPRPPLPARPPLPRTHLGRTRRWCCTARPPTHDERELEPMPDNAFLLRVALTVADRGWHVFPLRPDDKRPAVHRWEARATTDADRIRRCWASGPYGV